MEFKTNLPILVEHSEPISGHEHGRKAGTSVRPRRIYRCSRIGIEGYELIRTPIRVLEGIPTRRR